MKTKNFKQRSVDVPCVRVQALLLGRMAFVFVPVRTVFESVDNLTQWLTASALTDSALSVCSIGAMPETLHSLRVVV